MCERDMTEMEVDSLKKIQEILAAALGIDENETTGDGLITLERVACLGCCSLAPAMMINERVYGGLTPDRVVEIVEEYRKD